MSNTFTGTVSNIRVIKNVNTKYGEKPIFGFDLGGTTIETGFDHPDKKGIKAGDNITAETEYKYKTYKLMSFRPAQEGDTSEPAVTSSPSGGKRQFPYTPNDPGRAINRQNALTAAVAMLSNGYYGELNDSNMSHAIAATIRVARRFEAYTTGDVERRAAEEGIELEEYMKGELD